MSDQLICPRCGAPNPPDAQSCSNCGWAPSPPAAVSSTPTGGAAGSVNRRRRPPWLLAIIGAGVVMVVILAIVLIIRLVQPGNGPAVAPPPASSPSSSASSPDSSPHTSATADRSTPAATPAPDFDKIAASVKSGVFQVVASSCGATGSRIGSAFLVDENTAVTSYAALAGAKVVALTSGSTTVPATVGSADPQHGVVVLDLDRSVDGHVFGLDTTEPKQSDPIGVLGITAETSASKVVQSRVLQTDQSSRVGDTTVDGLVAVGGSADDPGWYGAPTLAADGSASGMVLGGAGSGQTMIIPGSAIETAVGGHRALPKQDCARIAGPETTTLINGKPTAPVEKVLSAYFGAINAGDYPTAYAQLGPGSKPSGTTEAEFAKGWETSYDFNIVVHRVTGSGDNTQAHVSFDSIFAKGRGPDPSITCARWDIDYSFINQDGDLLINKSVPHAGRIWHEC